mmetsp:Transcript_21945/g.70673  ORF Transcript_21945/g.70673 Transcript_21945/m.70673 type:complete len:183 (-) Transcript_21945:225-773(-)
MRKYLQEREVLMLGGKLDLVVGTPGRLNDMLRDQTIRTKNVRHLVLDEADRMLDLGFEPQISAILGHMRHDRQSLLFSATWPAEVQTLAGRLIAPSHVIVEVGGALATSGRANTSIEQRVLLCDDAGKMEALLTLLEEDATVVVVSDESSPFVWRRCSRSSRRLWMARACCSSRRPSGAATS